jgi:hypothetical protein
MREIASIVVTIAVGTVKQGPRQGDRAECTTPSLNRATSWIR